MPAESPDIVSVAIGLLGLGAQIFVPAALFVWGRSVARRRGGRAWMLASYLPLVAAIAALLGLLATAVGLTQAFGAVGGAPPSERASLLAEGIGTAMWGTAIGVAVSVMGYVMSLVLFAGAELSMRRASKGASPAP